MEDSKNHQPTNEINSSEDDVLDVKNYEIQDKILKINEWKFYKVIDKSKEEYMVKSSSKPLNKLNKGKIINFFRGIDNNSKLIYPTILKYVGYSLNNFKNKPKPVIFTEYASKYNLQNLISQLNKNEQISEWTDTKKLITIYGIASGMSYLHSNNIIHCNLDLESVFLDINFHPKITNFEYSKKLPEKGFINEHEIKGNIMYQPPEVLSRLTYSKSSDVYSFSLVMYSILTNKEPFQKLRVTTEIIRNFSIKNEHLPFNFRVSNCFKDLIERCWSSDSKKRPTFDEILNELKTNKEFITEKVNKGEYENYIKWIEESPKSFVIDKKERKDIRKHLNEMQFITNDNTLNFDSNNKYDFDLTKYKNDILGSVSTNECIIYYGYLLSFEVYRKELRFFYRNELINFVSKLNVISQVNHPAILKFIGFNSVDFNGELKPVIVTEYFGASLNLTYLRRRDSVLLTTKSCLIYGIAAGMAFLHSHGIIHRDLKISNIYSDMFHRPKIGGFDLAIELNNKNSIKCDQIKGTPAYLAPEVFKYKEYSRKSDVYSFGLLVYEILTARHAFGSETNPKKLKEIVMNDKIHLNFDENPINATYRELIEKCIKTNPNERPSFDEILQELKTNRDFISEDIYEDYFYKYIDFIDNNEKISFNPEERFGFFDTIIETKLHTFQDIKPHFGLTSIYDTEYNDLIIDNYNYLNWSDYSFDDYVNYFFYSTMKTVHNETNEVFLTKYPKKEFDSLSKSDIINFSQELSIISQISHPSIIKFYGYNPTNLCCEILVEYAQNESLDIVIDSINEQNSILYMKPSADECIDLNYTKKLIIIYGIAAGMSYLHQHNILHRDLKTSNILLDNLMHPKISGFNIAIENNKEIIKCDQIKGTPAYLAPETYKYKEYSRKSDVYSFGLIIYELMTGKKVFELKMSPKKIKEKLENDQIHLNFDENPINIAYRELIEKCIKINPNERPTFDEILNELKTNRGFINETINEVEYQEYIKFITESKEISFNPSNRISYFDIIIKNRLNDFNDVNERINFRSIYDTEYNNVLFDYDFIDLSDYEKIDCIEESINLKKYSVKEKKTGKMMLAFRFMQSFDEFYIMDKFVSTNLYHINRMIGLDHPAILKFVGYCPYDFKNRPNPMFIVEPPSNGSIDELFKSGENKKENTLFDDTKRLINIYGIASAMAYMHSINRYHSDLDIEQVKLDDYLYPKLTESTEIMDEKDVYDDIYCFGTIVFALIKNDRPMDDDDVLAEVTDDNFPPCYKNLIEKCLNDDMNERPSFEEIVYHLRTNPEFVTEKVNKEEFINYVNYIDNGQKDTNIFKNDFVSSNNYNFRKVQLPAIKNKKEKSAIFTVDMGSVDIIDYEKIERIGEGAFGVVYTVLNTKTQQVYAAKRSRFSIDRCSNDFIVNITREINIISQLKHICILQFIGYSPMNFKNNKRKPVIITEYIANGSLGHLLKMERKGFAPSGWDDTKRLINIYGIASGMKYIHNFNILHRDLKPDNILLDDNLYPKICDFGLSKNLLNRHLKSVLKLRKGRISKRSELIGTPAYLAPEILKNHIYTEKGDVYSFGLICYQILINEALFEDFQMDDLLTKVANGYRPIFKYQIPYCYKSLIEKCWSQDPNDRPTFEKIVDLLENDSRFITSNIDDNEFRNFISLTKGKLFPTVNSFDDKKPTIIKIDERGEREKIQEEDIFLNLNEFEILSVVNYGKSSKIYKLKEKETKLIFQGQKSMNKIDLSSSDDIQKMTQLISMIKNFKHKSLLKFIGYSPTDFKRNNRPVIVTEFPSNGSLFDLLEIVRTNEEIKEWNSTKKLMNIYGIASALSYLHSKGIIHRSLSPETVYLDDFFLPEIGDFGLSTFIDNSKTITHQSIAQSKSDFIYLAPEVISKKQFSKSSDVYAFAMIVFQIVTGEIPFDDVDNDKQIMTLIVKENYRPKINNSVPNSYKKLIQSCWAQNPGERPSFDEIVRILTIDNGFITEEIKTDDYKHFIDFINEKTNSIE